MAEGTVTDPPYVLRLTTALASALPDAEIDHEKVRTDRYRLIVVSNSFENKGHPERQRLVWDIADGVLDKDDLMRVSMILTIAPTEIPDE